MSAEALAKAETNRFEHERTSRNSVTYKNPDGSFTREIHLSKINYKGPDGKYHAINTALVPTASGFENTENEFISRFPAKRGQVKYSIKNSELSWELKGLSLVDFSGSHFNVKGLSGKDALAKGSKLKYVSVAPGIDDEYIIGSGEVKNNIIINSAQDWESAEYLKVTGEFNLPKGAEVFAGNTKVAKKTTVSGGFEIRLPGGETADVKELLVYDNYFEAGAEMKSAALQKTTKGFYEISVKGSVLFVSGYVKASWFGSGVKYPVCVDPTVSLRGRGSDYLQTVDDGGVYSTTPDTTNGAGVFFWVARDSGSGQITRAFMRFSEIDSIPNTYYVRSAVLKMYTASYLAGSQEYDFLEIYPVTKPWVEAEVTWNRYSAANLWTTPGGDYDPDFCASRPLIRAGGSVRWDQFNITPLVEAWISGSRPNNGFVLKCTDEREASVTQNFGARYESSEAADALTRPVLKIDYYTSAEGINLTSGKHASNSSFYQYYNISYPYHNTSITDAGTGIMVGGDNAFYGPYRGFVQFDLESLPRNINVTASRICLKVKGAFGGACDIDMHKVLNPWDEKGLSWVSRTADTNWSAAGGDYDPTFLSSLAIPNGPGVVYFGWTIDPALVKGWIDGSQPNNGVMFRDKAEGSGDGLIFYSFETDASVLAQPPYNYQPRMDITFTAAAGFTPPELQLPLPNSYVDDTVIVKWRMGSLDTLPDPLNLSYRIEYSDNGGGSWNHLTITAKSKVNTYLWNTKALTAGNNYMVRVAAYDNAGVNSAFTTSGVFEIIHGAAHLKPRGFSVSPPVVQSGDTVMITGSLINTYYNGAYKAAPSGLVVNQVSGGSAVPEILNGTDFIPPHGIKAFTWIYRTTSSGTINFSAAVKAFGGDGNTGQFYSTVDTGARTVSAKITTGDVVILNSTPSATMTPSPTFTATATSCTNPFSAGMTSAGANTYTSGTGVIKISQVVLSEDAYLKGTGLQVKSAAGTFSRMAVYRDNAGKPGTLISESAPKALVNGYNYFNLTGYAYLTAGTYWVAFVQDGAAQIGFSVGVSGDAYGFLGTYGPMPADLSAATAEANIYPATLDYCPKWDYWGNREVFDKMLATSMDGANVMVSYRFLQINTDTINGINLYYNAITGAQPTYRASIQADNAGLPSGTPLTSGTFAVAAAPGWTSVPVTGYTLTGGVVYHLVIEYSAGSIAANKFAQIVMGQNPRTRLMPYLQKYDNASDAFVSIDTGGTWLSQGISPLYFFSNAGANNVQGRSYTTKGSQGVHGNGTGGVTTDDRMVKEDFTGPDVSFGSFWASHMGVYVSRTASVPADSLYYIIYNQTDKVTESAGTFAAAAAIPPGAPVWFEIQLSAPVYLETTKQYTTTFSSPLSAAGAGYSIVGDVSIAGAGQELVTWGGGACRMYTSVNGGALWTSTNGDMAIRFRKGSAPVNSPTQTLTISPSYTNTPSVTDTITKTVTETITQTAIPSSTITPSATIISTMDLNRWGDCGITVADDLFDDNNNIIIQGNAGTSYVFYQYYDGSYYVLRGRNLDASGASLFGGDVIPGSTANQTGMHAVPDGSGGVVVVWQDLKNGNYDIYAQRLDSSWNPLWGASGIAVSVFAGNQGSPKVARSSDGGFIIIWSDNRGAFANIYAQKLNAAGAAQWAANGTAVCAFAGNQFMGGLVPDLSGGAVIAWDDLRAGGINTDIYCQNLSSGGAAQWTANGVQLTTDLLQQSNVRIVEDGTGGAILAWQDMRAGNSDIYAQRVNSSGAAQWTAGGKVICNDIQGQFDLSMSGDGAGNAALVWSDERAITDFDIYGQVVDISGNPQWTAGGEPVCTETGTQSSPLALLDVSGNAYFSWTDVRDGVYMKIFAQKMSAAGVKAWGAQGQQVCSSGIDMNYPSMIVDGSGGVIISWSDNRGGNEDIYASKLNTAAAPTQTYTSTADITQTFTQTVTITGTASPTPTVTQTAIPPDAYEPDNSTAQASVITVDGAAQAHNAHTLSDYDYIKFAVVPGVRYIVEIFNYSGLPNAMYMYNCTGAGAPLASANGAPDWIMEYDSTDTCFYYIRVDQSIVTAGSTYEIRVTSLALTPTFTVTPSYTVTATQTVSPTEIATACACEKELGNNVAGSSSADISGRIHVNRYYFYSGTDAYATGIMVYVAATNGTAKMRAAIYSAAGMNHGMPRVQSDEITPVTGWNYLEIADEFINSVSFPQGVLLALNTEPGIEIAYDDTALPPDQHQISRDPVPYGLFGILETDLNAGNTRKYSAYIVYCPVDCNITPTNTPSPEDTPVYTPTITPTNMPAMGGCVYQGNTNAGAFTDSTIQYNNMRASRYYLDAGTVLQISVNVGSGAGGNISAAIYSDFLNAPDTLLAQSAAKAMVNGWNTLQINCDILLPGYYWLAFMPSVNGVGFNYDLSGAVVNSANSAFGGGAFPSWPGSWGISNPDTRHWSIYAQVCAANTPTVTQTATETVTLTATLTSTLTYTLTATSSYTSTATKTATPTVTPSETCGAIGQFGRTAAGGSNWASTGDVLNSAKYTLGQDGTALSMAINLQTGSAPNKIKVAVYADAAGVPGALLAESAPQDSAAGWNYIDLPDTYLPAGIYWLAFIADGFINVYYAAGVIGDAFYGTPYSTALPFPAPFGSGTPDNFRWSIYVNFCAASGFVNTPTPTVTRTNTRTFTPTQTFTATNTQTVTQTVTQTITETVTQTITQTATETVTPTITQTVTQTITQTVTETVTMTITQTATQTITQTATETVTATITQTVTQTITQTVTETVTPTITQTVTQTATQTVTGTVTQTITETITQTITQTATPTVTQTVTMTVTQTITETVTVTVTDTVSSNTPTNTQTFTATPTVTQSATQTVTQTNTPTVTETSSLTNTPTYTATPTFTWTLTSTLTPTETSSVTNTTTYTATPTFTWTLTSTLTPTETSSVTNTATYTATPTFTWTLSSTLTQTETSTATDSPTYTATPTFTWTLSSTLTQTETSTATDSPTYTATPTYTWTLTSTLTQTQTSSATETATYTVTNTATESFTNTATYTASPTATGTYTGTPTFTGTQTNTPVDSPTNTPTFTLTAPPTHTFTVTLTHTVSPTHTASPTVTNTPTPDIAAQFDKNYFNPSEGETLQIGTRADVNTRVYIKAYNLSGEVVRKHEYVTSVTGWNIISWDGKNDAGKILGQGMYFIHVHKENGKSEIKRVYIVK